MSEIEKNYLRQSLVSNKKIWLVVGIVMFMILPFGSTLFTNVGVSVFGFNDYYRNTLHNIVPFLIFGITTIALALGLAIYQFRFLMDQQHGNLLFSLPIKRASLFRIHFFSGILLLFFFTFISFVLTLLVSHDVISNLGIYASVFACGEVLGLVCYSLFALLTLLANRVSDAVVLCVVYFILPLFFLVCAQSYFHGQINQIYVAQGGSWNEFISISTLMNPLTPLISFFGLLLQQLLSLPALLEHGYPIYLIDTVSLWYCGYWILLAGIAYIVAQHLFCRRKGEEGGQQTTSFFAYPLLIFLVTILLVLINVNLSWEGSINVIFIFLFYFGLTCFALRRIKLTWSIALRFLSILVIVSGFTFSFQITKGFHLLHEIPEEGDVENYSISLNSDTSVCIDGNSSLYPDVSQVCGHNFYAGDKAYDTIEYGLQESLALQKNLVQAGNDSTSNTHFMLEIVYHMKDGTYATRYYNITDIKLKKEVKDLFSQFMNNGYLDFTIYGMLTEEWL